MNIVRILTMMLFCLAAAVVTGCGDSRYDSRLLAADSLINARPDSALTLLSGIAPGEMAGSADRAYFSLLITQAKYKCYENIGSTDTIDIAVDYFDRHGDREKYTRSLIYKGAVLDELGDKTEAMLWYKRAEEAASPDDYENLGYVNMRMASLYRKACAESNLHIEKYKNAYRYYIIAKDTANQLKCLNYIGPLYRASDTDSAYHYIFKAIKLAEEYGDRESVIVNYAYLARAYAADSLYEKERDVALYAIQNGKQYLEDYFNECCYDLCHSYAKLGKTDSAQYYMRMATSVQSKRETVSRNLALADLQEALGNHAEAYRLLDSATRLAHAIESTSGRQQILDTEKLIEKHMDEVKKLENERRNIVVSIVMLLMCVTIILLYRRHINKVRDLRYQLSQIELDLVDSIGKEFEKDTQISKSALAYLDRTRQMMELYHSYGNSPQVLYRKFIGIINDTSDREQFNAAMRSYVNTRYSGKVEELCDRYPKLSDADINVICMLVCGFSNIIISIYMGYKTAHYVYNKKNMIAAKMNLNMSLDSFIYDFFK